MTNSRQASSYYLFTFRKTLVLLSFCCSRSIQQAQGRYFCLQSQILRNTCNPRNRCLLATFARAQCLLATFATRVYLCHRASIIVFTFVAAVQCSVQYAVGLIQCVCYRLNLVDRFRLRQGLGFKFFYFLFFLTLKFRSQVFNFFFFNIIFLKFNVHDIGDVLKSPEKCLIF